MESGVQTKYRISPRIPIVCRLNSKCLLLMCGLLLCCAVQNTAAEREETQSILCVAM